MGGGGFVIFPVVVGDSAIVMSTEVALSTEADEDAILPRRPRASIGDSGRQTSCPRVSKSIDMVGDVARLYSLIPVTTCCVWRSSFSILRFLKNRVERGMIFLGFVEVDKQTGGLYQALGSLSVCADESAYVGLGSVDNCLDLGGIDPRREASSAIDGNTPPGDTALYGEIDCRRDTLVSICCIFRVPFVFGVCVRGRGATDLCLGFGLAVGVFAGVAPSEALFFLRGG